jgi:hypothetical protein
VRRVSPLHGVCAVKNLSLRPYGEEWCYAVPIPHIRHCSALRDTMYKEIAPCVALCLDDPWSRFFFFLLIYAVLALAVKNLYLCRSVSAEFLFFDLLKKR